MSTDARNGSDDDRPTGPDGTVGDETFGETAAEEATADDTASGAPEPNETVPAPAETGTDEAGAEEPASEPPTADEPPSAGPLDPAAEAEVEHEPASTTESAPDADLDPATAEPEPAAAPAADPALDETHVAAIPVQRRREGFDEVDGGDTAVPEPVEESTSFVPTADEDEALREERARRFGRPRADDPAEPAAEGTPSPAVPLAAAGAGAVATVGATEAGTATRTMPTSETPAEPATPASEEDPFKDFDEGPLSRVAAHWWSILIAVVFVPIGWYLVADGGERLDYNLTNGIPFNIAAPLELAAGALCLFFVLLATRWSSVGAILVGTVAALAGIAFIVFTDEAMALVGEYQGVLVQGLEQLGQNIVDHMLADLRTGRIAVYGFVLVMAGVISHGARRQGRREERRRAAIGA